MNKQYLVTRKVSAIVAMALAVVVSFAAINSYGDSKSEDFIVYDIEASVEKAFADLTEQNLVIEIEEEQAETIKIYNSDFELVKSLTVSGDEVIEDEETQQLLNRAEYLSSFGSTSVYKIIE